MLCFIAWNNSHPFLENQDIGIVMEGQTEPFSMVSINVNLFVADLRDAIAKDGDITFPYRFIARSVVGYTLSFFVFIFEMY